MRRLRAGAALQVFLNDSERWLIPLVLHVDAYQDQHRLFAAVAFSQELFERLDALIVFPRFKEEDGVLLAQASVVLVLIETLGNLNEGLLGLAGFAEDMGVVEEGRLVLGLERDRFLEAGE